jgi:hypothetical protein
LFVRCERWNSYIFFSSMAKKKQHDDSKNTREFCSNWRVQDKFQLKAMHIEFPTVYLSAIGVIFDDIYEAITTHVTKYSQRIFRMGSFLDSFKTKSFI